VRAFLVAQSLNQIDRAYGVNHAILDNCHVRVAFAPNDERTARRLTGLIVALWPADGGRYPPEAHQAAMAAGLGLQLLALGVFCAPRRRPRPTPMAVAVARALGYDMVTIPPASAARVAPWAQHASLLGTYATGWRLAACAATMLCIAISTLLSTAVDRAGAALYAADNGQVAKVPTGGSPLDMTETAALPVVQEAAFSASSLPAFGHPRIDDDTTERLTAFALHVGASIAAWAATAPAPVPTATVSGFLLLLTMLTAILVAADRRTEARSRRAWARLDLASARLPPRPDAPSGGRRDPAGQAPGTWQNCGSDAPIRRATQMRSDAACCRPSPFLTCGAGGQALIGQAFSDRCFPV
jgi:hypothetical protein